MTSRRICKIVNELVGVQEIALALGVKRQTAQLWSHSGKLPKAEWKVSGVPVWRWETIEEWAKETGRL